MALSQDSFGRKSLGKSPTSFVKSPTFVEQDDPIMCSQRTAIVYSPKPDKSSPPSHLLPFVFRSFKFVVVVVVVVLLLLITLHLPLFNFFVSSSSSFSAFSSSFSIYHSLHLLSYITSLISTHTVPVSETASSAIHSKCIFHQFNSCTVHLILVFLLCLLFPSGLMLKYFGVRCLVLHILLNQTAAFVFSNFGLVFFWLL